MDRTCNTHAEMRLPVNCKGRESLGDITLPGKIILNLILGCEAVDQI